jgi:hypothetical protein
MLANQFSPTTHTGSLSKDVHLPATSLNELLDFIADELPNWRDRPDRPNEVSETNLTSQLCAHLNSVARHSVGWDFLQFRTEEPDEVVAGRKIDLVSSPCGTTVWIEGRRHVDFDAILPIECKRLPTPKRNDRDEREYVISQYSTTGGIQRFKEGHYGAAHALCAMIAYVQDNSRDHWNTCICQWIMALASSKQSGWSNKDVLQVVREDENRKITVLTSTHTRANGLPDIQMRHLWVQMN